MGVVHNGGGSGNGEDDMADDSGEDRVHDGLETAQVGVGNISAKQRNQVDPKLVEGRQASGGLGAHAEGTGLSIVGRGVECFAGSSARVRLGDEVDENLGGAVVRKTLDQLDKGNGESLEGDLLAYAAEGDKLLLGGDGEVVVEVLALVDRSAIVDGGQLGLVGVDGEGALGVAAAVDQGRVQLGAGMGVGNVARHDGQCWETGLRGTNGAREESCAAQSKGCASPSYIGYIGRRGPLVVQGVGESWNIATGLISVVS